MSSASEIRAQVEKEGARRPRLAVPAVGAGVVYLLSGITVTATLNGAPSVGLVQTLAPALRGEPEPAVSPRAAVVKFISHHAFVLIVSSAFAAIAIGVLVLVLAFLFDAVRFRRPETWTPGGPLAIVGGAGLAVINLVHEVLRAIESHSFVTGRDLSRHAADRALLLAGTKSVVIAILAFLFALMLAVGMIGVMVGAMRAGLLPRWLSILGLFSGGFFLPFFQSATLQLVTAFWLVAMGILLIGRWPSGDPPAWAAGEARPWPSQAQMRARRSPARAGGKDAPGAEPSRPPARADSSTDDDVAPAPARPSQAGGARKRRRKRGTRR